MKPALYKSGFDAYVDIIKNFIANTERELVVIAPFIKTDVLHELASSCIGKITVITTWDLHALQTGSSELELFTYCKENGFYLFLNPRVHLKAFIKDFSSCLFGSANITGSGLALVDKYNYELLTKIEEIDSRDILYFRKILQESTLVNDHVYGAYKKEVEKMEPIKRMKEIEVKGIQPRPEFLISALPMSKDVDTLYEIYSSGIQSDSDEALHCAVHDILLYDLPQNGSQQKPLSKQEFIALLRKRFFASKFIIKLLDFIGKEKYFGRVKEWVQHNCEDVPVPSRRDLTRNIQVLYRWIVDLSDGRYQVDVPKRHSERIYRVDKHD